MARPNDFDLTAALSRWRESLASHEALTPERVRELESHLRDTLAGIRTEGITAEEAFWVAARRVGEAAPLSSQFAAANPASVWRARVFWMVMGMIVVEMAVMLPGLLRFATLQIQGGNPFWQTFFFVGAAILPFGLMVIALLAFAALASGRWPRLRQRMEAFCTRRGRFAWPLFLVTAFPALAMMLLQIHLITLGTPSALMPRPREMIFPALFGLALSIAFAAMAAAYAPKQANPSAE